MYRYERLKMGIMRTRIWAILLCLLLTQTLSAQEYAVRVTHNTNLRASYSLQARIVDKALAGTTLQVVDAFDRWLKVDHGEKSLWMAGWVPMTRVTDAPVIDNCCFVDRQCQSEQEWLDGYWAFQRDECPAPAQTETPAQSQASSAVSAPVSIPANVDNCCQLGNQCATNGDWINGYIAFQVNQCKHPGLLIEGSPGFISMMETALDMLKQHAPKWYAYTDDGLSRIMEASGLEIIYVRGGIAYFGTDTYVARTGDPVVHAGLLVHEACHPLRHRAGQQSGGVEGESACTQIEIHVLDLLGGAPDRRALLQLVLDNIHDPAYQWWHE